MEAAIIPIRGKKRTRECNVSMSSGRSRSRRGPRTDREKGGRRRRTGHCRARNRKAAESSRLAAFMLFRACDLVMRVPDLQCDSYAARSHTRISRGVRTGGYFRSAAPAPPGIGFWLIMRCAYGVSAHMIQVPIDDDQEPRLRGLPASPLHALL